jgi:hypothetical protein
MDLGDKRYVQELYEEAREKSKDFYKNSRGIISHWRTESQEWRDYEERVSPFYRKVLNALYELNLAIEERMNPEKDKE